MPAASGDQGQGQGQGQGDQGGVPPDPADSGPTAPSSNQTDTYPGQLDQHGIRRFADTDEANLYADRVLEDPNVNPHAYDNLPLYQQSAAWGYTRNSWINVFERQGSQSAGQQWLDQELNRTRSDPQAFPGWTLYELNGRSTPTVWDLMDARGRPDLSDV